MGIKISEFFDEKTNKRFMAGVAGPYFERKGIVDPDAVPGAVHGAVLKSQPENDVFVRTISAPEKTPRQSENEPKHYDFDDKKCKAPDPTRVITNMSNREIYAVRDEIVERLPLEEREKSYDYFDFAKELKNNLYGKYFSKNSGDIIYLTNSGCTLIVQKNGRKIVYGPDHNIISIGWSGNSK